MASQNDRSDKFVLLANSLFLLGAVCNFIFLAFAISGREPRIERHIDTVVSNHFFTVTQYIDSVSSPSLPSSSAISEYRLPYRYFMVDGERYIRFYGRFFGEGSPTSYGRIVRIFPDRVQLDNGSYIANTINPDGDSLSSPPSNIELQRSIAHD